MPRGIYKRNKNNKKVGRKKIDWRYRAEEAKFTVNDLNKALDGSQEANRQLLRKYDELNASFKDIEHQNVKLQGRLNESSEECRRQNRFIDSMSAVIITLGKRVQELEELVQSFTIYNINNSPSMMQLEATNNETEKRKQN